MFQEYWSVLAKPCLDGWMLVLFLALFLALKYYVWKWCEIDQGASEDITEVGQRGKTEETVWQPEQNSSQHTEVLEYP